MYFVIFNLLNSTTCIICIRIQLMMKILNKCIISILVYNLYYRQTAQYFHTTVSLISSWNRNSNFQKKNGYLIGRINRLDTNCEGCVELRLITTYNKLLRHVHISDSERYFVLWSFFSDTDMFVWWNTLSVSEAYILWEKNVNKKISIV